MIVADSSPIIILAKQGMLEILKKCFEKVIIPESVYNEIRVKEGSTELLAIEKAIKSEWIAVQKASIIPELDTKNIGKGEKEAISLAFQHKSILLIDDDTARKYASIFGVEAHGTLYVIYAACLKKLIDKSTARNAVENIIADDFYISSEIYSRFLSLLETIG